MTQQDLDSFMSCSLFAYNGIPFLCICISIFIFIFFVCFFLSISRLVDVADKTRQRQSNRHTGYEFFFEWNLFFPFPPSHHTSSFLLHQYVVFKTTTQNRTNASISLFLNQIFVSAKKIKCKEKSDVKYIWNHKSSEQKKCEKTHLQKILSCLFAV